MSKSKIPGDLPADKKPEIERDPDDQGDQYEPEITDAPEPEMPDMDKPAPDKPEIDIPVDEPQPSSSSS